MDTAQTESARLAQCSRTGSRGYVTGPGYAGGVLKIATWNLNHWRTAAEARGRTWNHLEQQIRPDVALVQEAAPLDSHGRVVWRPGGIGGKGWGSAIVSYWIRQMLWLVERYAFTLEDEP